jgi:L-2-hydroxyglutarate oxidase LhgO
VKPENYQQWGRAGIRAQLLDVKRKQLVMDFIFEHDGKSMHVLNAVSPGFTCSLPFSRHIVDDIK